jgi:hypothetical protein
MGLSKGLQNFQKKYYHRVSKSINQLASPSETLEKFSFRNIVRNTENLLNRVSNREIVYKPIDLGIFREPIRLKENGANSLRSSHINIAKFAKENGAINLRESKDVQRDSIGKNITESKYESRHSYNVFRKSDTMLERTKIKLEIDRGSQKDTMLSSIQNKISQLSSQIKTHIGNRNISSK